MKIRTKLSILLVVLTSLVISAADYFSLSMLSTYYHDRMIDELKIQIAQFDGILRQEGSNDSISYSFIQHLAHVSDVRLTLITEDGTVVFESELPREQLGSLENHRDRPEVRDARSGEYGISTRHSATLNIEMMYLAKHLSEPIIFGHPPMAVSTVRVGLPLTLIHQRLSDLQSKLITLSILILIIVVAVSLLVVHRLTMPVRIMNATANKIRNGNLDVRIPIRSKDELGELGTTLNNMIDQLNNDITRLKKLERVRTEFLGNVSHELRTPIFTIQGMLETLLNGALDDKEVSKDFIERALRNTRRLGTLLGDLIEISRIESGDMKMSYRYFDVDEFLQTLVGEFSQEAEKRNIVLRYNRPGRRIEVLGDRDRLRQVMVNLIDNALKYTPEQGLVELILEPGQGEATIIVKDTGVGISEEHLTRIFERFYRVDKERSREAGGTGLGLAIVKHIVEAHSSVIHVESAIGKGSTFRFSLKT